MNTISVVLVGESGSTYNYPQVRIAQIGPVKKGKIFGFILGTQYPLRAPENGQTYLAGGEVDDGPVVA